MSISNTTYLIQALGDGVTQTFSFPFKIFSASQLIVEQITPANVVLTFNLGTDYTVSINPIAEGGTVTWTVAPPLGYIVQLQRSVPYTQSVVLATEGALPALQVTNQLDLMTMMIIQTYGQAVQAPTIFAGALPLVLPTPVPGLTLAWDSTGKILVNVTPSSIGLLQVPIANSNLVPLTLAGLVSGATFTLLGNIPAGAGTIPAANLPFATGTAPGNVPVLDSNSKVAYANLEPFPRIKISNTQASGTNGGTATSGSWLGCAINTKDNDSANIATLSGGNLAIPAGTYKVFANQRFYATGASQIRLYNNSLGTPILYGTNANGGVSSYDSSTLIGEFTVAAVTTISLQYQVGSTENTNGQGVAYSYGSEVFAIVELEKIA